MLPETIQPTTWAAVFELIAGAAWLLVPAALAVVLFWLRNVKTSLDIAHKQQKLVLDRLEDNTEVTKQVELQTNGSLRLARKEGLQWRAAAERLASELKEVRWLVDQLQHNEEGRVLIDRIMSARRAVVYDGDYDTLLIRLMEGK